VNLVIIVVLRDHVLGNENFPRFWDLFWVFSTMGQDWLAADVSDLEIGRVEGFIWQGRPSGPFQTSSSPVTRRRQSQSFLLSKKEVRPVPAPLST
jgi:hypothetical protein